MAVVRAVLDTNIYVGALLSHYADGLMITPTNTYGVVSDDLGTPRLLVDKTTGAVVERMDFDEFGQATTDSNPGFQVLGFADGIYDTDTGLVRFGARDYDPETGRWTAKDPIRVDGGDSSLYRYVLGDSVNLVDPIGKAGSGSTNGPTSGSPSSDASDAFHSCHAEGEFKRYCQGPAYCRMKWYQPRNDIVCLCTTPIGDLVCPSRCDKVAMTGQP